MTRKFRMTWRFGMMKKVRTPKVLSNDEISGVRSRRTRRLDLRREHRQPSPYP